MTRAEALSLLGLAESFSEADLKKAYRVAARKHHPDTGGSEAAFITVKKAFDYLSATVSPVRPAKILFTHQSIFSVARES